MITFKFSYITRLVADIQNVCGTFFCYDVVVWLSCLSALETGYGTSLVYHDNSNLFGMRFPNVRPHTARGVLHGHADYFDFDSCIVDFVIWCMYHNISSNRLNLDLFREWFSRLNYNPSSKYVDTVNSIYIGYCQTLKNQSK